MLSQYLAELFIKVLRNHGPLSLALWLKTVKLSLYKALAKDSASFAPGGKLMPVSLSRSGFPRCILKVHRKVMGTPLSERSHTLVRMYVTALDIYKLIICEPKAVDLSSVNSTEGLLLKSEDGTVKLANVELDFIGILERIWPRLRQMPLITGLGDKMIWTATPVVGPLCNSAYIREQVRTLFPEMCSGLPRSLMQARLVWPPGGGESRVAPYPWLDGERTPVLKSESLDSDSEVEVPQMRFSSGAHLQDLIPVLLAQAPADDEDAILLRQLMGSLEGTSPPEGAEDLDPGAIWSLDVSRTTQVPYHARLHHRHYGLPLRWSRRLRLKQQQP